MVLNPSLATYYLLPLVELSKSSFGDAGDIQRNRVIEITDKSNFIDCHLSTENYIVVKVRDFTKVPKDSIANHYYFTDIEVIDPQWGKITLILYRVDAPFLDDLTKFREGKYSRMSENAKTRIIIFNVWSNKTDQLHQPLYGALYRSARMREDIEIKCSVILSPEDEVLSVPKPNSFIDLSKEFLELQTIPE